MSGPGDATHPRRRALAAVAVLGLDALLLALTELAWLTAPTGAVLAPLGAAVSTAVLVRAADRVVPGTRWPFVPLLVWTLTVLVVGFWSPFGGGVLPGDGRGVVLFAAGLLPAVLVLATRPVRPSGSGD